MTAIGATPPTAARAEAGDIVIGNFAVNTPFTTDISVAGLRTADGNYDTNSISNSNRFLTATVVRGKFANNGDFDINTDALFVKQSNKSTGIGTTNPLAIQGGSSTKLHVKAQIATPTATEVARFEGGLDGSGASAIIRLGTSNDRGIYLEGGRTGVVQFGSIGVTDAAGTKTEAIFIDDTGAVFLVNLKSGATQGGASAVANELWVASGHATEANGSLQIGL